MEEYDYTMKGAIPNRLWASLSIVSKAVISDLAGVSLSQEHKRNMEIVREEYLRTIINSLRTLRDNVKNRRFNFHPRVVEGLSKADYLIPLLMKSERNDVDMIFHTAKRLDCLIESFTQGKTTEEDKIYLYNLIEAWGEA